MASRGHTVAMYSSVIAATTQTIVVVWLLVALFSKKNSFSGLSVQRMVAVVTFCCSVLLLSWWWVWLSIRTFNYYLAFTPAGTYLVDELRCAELASVLCLGVLALNGLFLACVYVPIITKTIRHSGVWITIMVLGLCLQLASATYFIRVFRFQLHELENV